MIEINWIAFSVGTIIGFVLVNVIKAILTKDKE